MKRLLFLSFLGLIVFPGCDRGSDGTHQLDGDYTLETQGGEDTYTLEVTLNE